MPENTDATSNLDDEFAKTVDLDGDFGEQSSGTAPGADPGAGPEAGPEAGPDADLAEDSDAVDAEEEELSELEQAIRERDEAKALWLRAQADYQNLRRRTQADIESAVVRAKTEVLAEAVTVLDYLDMALAAPVTTDEAKNLKIGVEMTRTQLQSLFDRLAVKPIVAEGTFDPAFHQALSTVETTEHEPGTIMEVVRGGWQMGEMVLRFAQVRVAAEPEPDPEVTIDAEGSSSETAADAETVEIPEADSAEDEES